MKKQKTLPTHLSSERFTLIRAFNDQYANDFCVYFVIDKGAISKKEIERLVEKESIVNCDGTPDLKNVSVKGEVAIQLSNGEICYDVHKEYRGQGIASEVLNLMTQKLEKYCAFELTFLRIKEENITSQKVAKNCGYLPICINSINYILYSLEKNISKMQKVLENEIKIAPLKKV